MHAFLLNLDAELELEAPGRSHDVHAALERAPERAAQVGALLPAGSRLVRRGDALPAGAIGLAWCPTPRAQAELARCGATPAPAPPLEVLRRANDRALEAQLQPTLPHACFVRDLGELERALAPRPGVEAYLLKRAHAHRGRGRRLASRLDEPTRAFARRSFELGGLMVQPWVERLVDYALHGHVGRGGSVLGAPTLQRVNRGGAWLGTELASPGELSEREREALEAAALEAACLLALIGYHGPFGVDAFRYRLRGELRFCARCELNARYSMGWATGMGPRRPDLEPPT